MSLTIVTASFQFYIVALIGRWQCPLFMCAFIGNKAVKIAVD